MFIYIYYIYIYILLNKKKNTTLEFRGGKIEMYSLKTS